jgi:CRISPR-associated endonuclease/helicase Cas3
MDAYSHLKSIGLDKNKLSLFHSRFALCDRLDKEDSILAHFGKYSDSEVRRGRILIATQVVEQSLDLDFDLMITDLAPIDLMIQRAGRLRRHKRDASGNLLNSVDTQDLRGPIKLLIHGPIPKPDSPSDWYSSIFPGAASVYPDHEKLWLSAHTVMKNGGWTLPDDARFLIESVYGDDHVDTPASLKESGLKADGQSMADRSVAISQTLNLGQGYFDGSHPTQWLEDTECLTRLAEKSVTIRLCRIIDGCCCPWSDSGYDLWSMSELSVRDSMLKREDTESEFFKGGQAALAKDSMGDKGKWSVLVPLSPNDSGVWTGSGLNRGNERVTVQYSKEYGLIIQTDGE